MYSIIKRIIITIVCHILYRVKYENLEVLENVDRCLICPNHSIIFDPIYIYPKVDNLFIMAKSEIFKYKFIAKFLEFYNIFPIKRGQNDIRGIKHTIELFKENKKIRFLMFPEGGILENNENIRKVKDGAVYIACTVDVPVVPVYVTVSPKLFSRVTVNFGNPIKYDKDLYKDREKLKETSKQLLDTIYDLKT